MTAYAGWYLLAGMTFYVLFYAFVARKRARADTNLWADFVDGISGDKPLWDRFLNGLLVPTAAVALLLLAWPWLLWTTVAERAKGAGGTVSEGVKREFAVLDEFLVCELPLVDIECWETVEDPLGAAPTLPFGHLNPAWEEFKAGDENGAFWKFSGLHVDDWDAEWLREGYAVLKEDGTRPYFLTRVKYVGRDDGSE